MLNIQIAEVRRIEPLCRRGDGLIWRGFKDTTKNLTRGLATEGGRGWYSTLVALVT